MGNKPPQTLRLGERDYWLLPIGGETMRQTRAQRSELQRFDSRSLEKVPEYQYKKLQRSKKTIRLLQLGSGTTHGPEIFCELIQADYSNSFHIPTRVDDEEDKEDEKRKRKEDSGPPANNRKLSEKEREMKEKQQLEKEWEEVCSKKMEYEALSWCWGLDPPEYAVMIKEGGKTYKKRVRKELALALKYLRLPDRIRTLWIDAICINQDDHEERNHQVQMMSRVYTRAKEVCIWLGEDTDESKTAIDFIHEKITELKNIDAICSDKRYTEKWQALMMLMQRDWFSRRWVVQEIALAIKAKIYCGPDSIPWKEFAVAVELFVEVETATHRLSEIMQKDEKFRHIPNWFEHVSQLGASLLVQATGKVFRAQRTPMQDGGDEENEEERKKREEEVKDQMLKAKTIDPLDRRSLLSLEYLVSTMFIFKTTEPRDVIYALLAIARDAAPSAEKSTTGDHDRSLLTVSLLNAFLEEKPFVVDYRRPYADVCRDFIEFCIHRKNKLDPVQSLDILCRPWALEPQTGKSIRLKSKPNVDSEQGSKKKRLMPKREEGRNKRWFKIEKEPDKKWSAPGGWDEIEKYFPKKGGKEANEDGQSGTAEEDDLYEKEDKKLQLPSWVARASKAPFNLYHHPGQSFLTSGRAAADALVGHPQDGHRNYSAAQTRPLDPKALKFKRRPQLGHYSLYVTGFELDEVEIVKDASQGGNIPKSWLDLGDWEEPYFKDPPDQFWRTIVADRGRDNRNPPYYYARACKESVHKGGIASGRVNTMALINNERNSIVTEFCRRVQAVIWGRSLFKTKDNKLGLASDVQKGDKVCILYGCTVPVILRMHQKKKGEREKEELEDKVEALKSLVRKWEKNCERKAEYGPMKEKYKKRPAKEEDKKEPTEKSGRKTEWDEMMQAKQAAEDVLKKDAKARATAEAAKFGPSKRAIKTGGQVTSRNGENREGKDSRDEEAPEKNECQSTFERNKAEAKKEDPNRWYKFMGESYVHGMMDGEALREKFYKLTADRTFELR
ncbi:hypothetical protein DL768_000856 [Monosporascus sp. mg162]|nr:hypothetical protein DL768_000856 [Monosporascus sp. mg162]